MRFKVVLKGHLYWYDPEKRKEIEIEDNNMKSIRDILVLLKIPPAEVSMVLVNDSIKQLDDEIGDGDLIVFMPAIGGG